MKLDGKTAIVTGASRGIGRVAALELATSGANVIVNFLNDEAGATEVVHTIIKNGGRAISVQSDISDIDQSRNLIQTALDTYKGVDILVNNAGIVNEHFLVTMSDKELDRTFKINLYGAFYCSKFAVKQMIRQKQGGRIINVTSIAGITGRAKQSHYSASKAGLIGFTKSLARELGSWQITVNAVAPGIILSSVNFDLPQNEVSRLIEMIPLQRFGEAEDVAKAIVFLASEDAAYITGQIIRVDGGFNY